MKLIFNAYETKINLASPVELKGSEVWERETVASGASDDLNAEQFQECMEAARRGKPFCRSNIRLYISKGWLRCVRIEQVPAEFIQVESEDEANSVLQSRGIRFQECKPKRWVFFPSGDSNLGRFIDHAPTAYPVPSRSVPLIKAFMRLDGCDIVAGLVA
jgi:Zn finger protein HypA/HybF involved in hydrogenase expression